MKPEKRPLSFKRKAGRRDRRQSTLREKSFPRIIGGLVLNLI